MSKERRCNIDRGKLCRALEMTLDHEKNVQTSRHYPTMANVVAYDFGKKGYLTFKFCPYCGADLVSKMIKRWRDKKSNASGAVA